MFQVTCSFQNIRLKFCVSFLCPDAGQYVTVNAPQFNVSLDTFGGAVVKLDVLLSLYAAVAQ